MQDEAVSKPNIQLERVGEFYTWPDAAFAAVERIKILEGALRRAHSALRMADRSDAWREERDRLILGDDGKLLENR